MEQPIISSMSSMTFHYGASETVLFGFWKFSTYFGLFLSCLVLIIMCLAKEAARVGRMIYKKSMDNNGKPACPLTAAALHLVVLTLSYLLMAIFMNLNVWMCGTIIVAEVLAHVVSSYTSSLASVNFFEK